MTNWQKKRIDLCSSKHKCSSNLRSLNLPFFSNINSNTHFSTTKSTEACAFLTNESNNIEIHSLIQFKCVEYKYWKHHSQTAYAFRENRLHHIEPGILSSNPSRLLLINTAISHYSTQRMHQSTLNSALLTTSSNTSSSPHNFLLIQRATSRDFNTDSKSEEVPSPIIFPFARREKYHICRQIMAKVGNYKER